MCVWMMVCGMGSGKWLVLVCGIMWGGVRVRVCRV